MMGSSRSQCERDDPIIDRSADVATRIHKLTTGGMPQGSRLGPLSFIVLIDDLRAACEVHKFVDDTTFSELIPSTGSVSNVNMTSHLTSLLT